MENPYSSLKNKNEVAYDSIIPDHKNLVLFSAKGKKIARFEPSQGKLIRVTDVEQAGAKIDAASLKSAKLSSGAKGLYFIEGGSQIKYLDLEKDGSASVVVKKDSGNVTSMIPTDDGVCLITDNKPQAVCLKKEGDTFKEGEPINIAGPKGTPASGKVSAVPCGKSLAAVEIDRQATGIYNTKTWTLAEPDFINQAIGADNAASVLYDEKKKTLYVINGSGLTQYTHNPNSKSWVENSYSNTKFGKPQRLGLDGESIIVATSTHYLVYKNMSGKLELVAALKFKFAVDNAEPLVFLNSTDLSNVVLVKGDKADFVKITPFWDNVEPVPLGGDNKNPANAKDAGKTGATGTAANKKSQPAQGQDEGSDGYGQNRSGYNDHQDHEDQEYEEEEEGDQYGDGADAKKKPKKKKKKKVMKKRKRSFDLHGLHHIKSNEYNALRDEHLKSYFYSHKIRHHLIKQNLITSDGYIIENPEEFRKNQKLFREHYKSQEPKKKTKKKQPGQPSQREESNERPRNTQQRNPQPQGKQEDPKKKPVSKQEYNEFLDTLEQDIHKDGGAKKTTTTAAADKQKQEQSAREAAAKEQAAREQSAREKAAKEQAAKDQAAKEKAAKDQAAKDQAAKDQAAKDQAAKDAAAKDQAAKDAAAKDQAAKDKVAAEAKEKAAKEQAAKEQAAKEQAAKEQAAKDQAAKDAAAKAAAQQPAPPQETAPAKPLPPKPATNEADNEF